MTPRRSVRYAVVDAFTRIPFKGNPAAVCFLQPRDDDQQQQQQEQAEEDSHLWMQSVAVEFNLSNTAFVTPIYPPLFHLRWFTPVSEVKLCGHATLAAAHYLFRTGIATGDAVEFASESGVLTAKKVPGGDDGGFCVELDFPVVSVSGCSPKEVPSIPVTLGGATVIRVNKTSADDLLIELSSWKEVAGIQPQFDEIRQCPGRGIIITGPAPHGSGFDFFSCFFCPKMGVNEDPVCGSAHCALAPYWSEKLGKQNLIAFMASSRSGTLDLQMVEGIQRVRIRGEAVTVMEGSLLA